MKSPKLILLVCLLLGCFTVSAQYPYNVKRKKTSKNRYNVVELYPFVQYLAKGSAEIGSTSNYTEKGFMTGLGFSYVSAKKFTDIGFGFSLEPQFSSFTATGFSNPVVKLQEIKLPLQLKVSNENEPDVGFYPFFHSLQFGAYASQFIASSREEEFDKFDYGLVGELELGVLVIDLKLNYFLSLKAENTENSNSYFSSNAFTVGIMFPIGL